MAITRKFLGLHQPGLQSAAEFLFDSYARPSLADMRNVIVVVPGRRAGRRLLEVLVDRAESLRLRLQPPRIETVGRLPEHLYHPQRPFASELVQRLAWITVLQRTSPDRLQPFVPHPPADDEMQRWLDLGDLLRRQHVELAADRMDFRLVAARVIRFGGQGERRRWQTMARLQDDYHRLLDRLELWDLQTARLRAIELHECHTAHHIVLLGTVDMNVTMRAMLDQVADRVTALVIAPETWSARFDEHGCLVPMAWSDATIDFEDSQVEVVTGPQQQAEAVVRRIARYAGQFEASQITLGVPDEQLIPYLQRELGRRNVPARWGPGRPLSETGPFRLLTAVGLCLRMHRFRDWAVLVRHPDVTHWQGRLGVPPGWLTSLDRYQSEHLPYLLPDQWLGSPQRASEIQAALKPLTSRLAPLRERPRPLNHWSELLLDLLVEVYENREFDLQLESDRATTVSCERIRDALQGQAAIPAELVPVVAASDAIDMTLDEVRRDSVPPPAADAVELLGWLELPLDDAPALIATSLNEGFVPESVNTDLFLPNLLRARLGMLDNERRYARDAYALSVLQATRESLHLIAARSNREGDPLAPSRLLFATTDEAAARRALACFDRAAPPTGEPSDSLSPGPSAWAIPPRPAPLEHPPRKISVTGFRDYLACPYRFYLRHVLKLRVLNDHAEELDAAAFGSLAHEVLRSFGLARERDSTDEGEIRRALNRELNRYVARTFGRDTTPAVQVQAEQLRTRLHAFAAQQAEWAAQGWRIQHTEVPQAEHGEAVFAADSQSIVLTGRIDRIDVQRETGEWIILDYKTSDAAKDPEQAHRRHGQWVDLQLPLYRHLAQVLDVGQSPKLGYVLLPRDTGRTGFCIATWTADELHEADERAKQVVRDVLAQKFWPPTESADRAPEFAAICREGMRGP